jgi:hypothetical protein
MIIGDVVFRTIIAVLLLIATIILLTVSCSQSHAQNYFSQRYDGKQYRRCPLVDPYCEILPRQGQPLQPTPRDKRLTYQAAHDLAVQRGYFDFDPFERPGSTRPSPPPPQQAQSRMTKEQWKQAIIEEGNKFCNAFPNDEICHFKEPTPDAQPR